MIPDVLTDLLATVGAESPDPERGPGSGAVGVEDVSVTLGGQTILEDVSLTVEAGTFVGLIGPNGSGKTTLLRTMSAILAPESGRVRVSGTDVRGLSSRAVSQRVAVVPQDTHLAFDFDVRDVVAMGRTPYRPRISFGQRPDEATVDDAMERAQVDHLADRSIDAISGGERQRVLLARALAQDTPVLLLDEPTASLDINHQIRTLEIVRSLVEDSANLRFAENPSGSDAREDSANPRFAENPSGSDAREDSANPRFAENPSGSDARESGKTVIAAIHDLNLAAHYCDVLVLLGDGEVLAAGQPTDVLTESNLETAFGTQAVVTSHPVTGSVYVMALPDGATEERREHVHVVGGGATGARLLYLLSAAGFAVTTGALNEGDSDLETARHLGIEAVTLPPGAPMDEPTTAAVRAHVRDAAVTVVADVEIGVGNLPNLEAAAAAENLVVVEDRPFAERNFVGPEARARYEELRGQAVVVDETEVISTVEDVLAGRSPPRD